jgi:AraC family transcriptional regulator, regulatory protein of adaptative response / DNA-3-methyladenine glycosylase II
LTTAPGGDLAPGSASGSACRAARTFTSENGQLLSARRAIVEGMALDSATCRRARLARDARFDGRFFVAVRTTGVYCRPVCPAVPPAERNVTYFSTAAAAAEAGYRACLRCRPECAPGTPAWAGASTTVVRALRLIGDGTVDLESVDELAARLGVGGRHLRRLFVEHLGASPVAVVQVGRLLSAKRLIDETDLPLTTVAMSAGYRSVRRFNAAFLESYGRSPRQLREASRSRAARSAAAAGGVYAFQLRFRPPFDWEAMLAFLAPRATAGVEVVDGHRYARSIEVDGQAGLLDVTPSGDHAMQLTVAVPVPARLLGVVSRVRRMFDLDADPMAVSQALAADPLLRPLIRRRPGLRVPGAWDGYELGVRAILGQQVSVAAATTLAGRLVTMFGRPVPGLATVERPAARLRTVTADPRSTRTERTRAEGESGHREVRQPTHLFPPAATLADAAVERIGIPAARGRAIQSFARAVADGRVSFDADTDRREFRERLLALPGIGEWTAEYIALRALGDPDAFPSSDLGLLKATGASSAGKLNRHAEAWRPWRGYAALHLWTASTSG